MTSSLFAILLSLLLVASFAIVWGSSVGDFRCAHPSRPGKGYGACAATDDSGGQDVGGGMVFVVSPEQRLALRSSDPDELEKTFQSLLGQIRETFAREGVVVIRGLFDDDELGGLESAGRAVVDQKGPGGGTLFESLKFGPVFSFAKEGEGEDAAETEKLTEFRKAALYSAVPAFVARVLLGTDDDGGDEKGQTLRVLKDVFLCKGKDESYCDWHVDDWSFWPTSARSPPGVNAWIALDDIPAKFGGGLAVSPRSHVAEWRHDAYRAIRSTQIYPEEGLEVGTDFFEENFPRTCTMNKNAPELSALIDTTKKVFDYRKGDVLFHTRWIFHRSVPVTEEGLEHFQKLGREPTFKRYSIRYETGSARLLRGLTIEYSAVLNPKNAGRSLNEVCEGDGPFYPRSWPRVVDVPGMEMAMKELATDKFPVAEDMQKESMKKIMPYYNHNN